MQKEKSTKSKDLSFLSININGLLNKLEDLQSLLVPIKFKFDIIAISETHLNITSEKFANMNGYKSLFNSRKLNGWGGVDLFVRSDLVFIPKPDITILIEGTFESVFVEAIEADRRYLVGSMYRPSNSDMTQFFQHLSATLSKIKDRKS